MLGYIVTYKPELKVKEAEWYKAYYCGVCKSISNRFGQIPRSVLSYDAAFLAIMIDSIFEEKEIWTQGRCIANPLKKRHIASSEAIDFAADTIIMLAWHKISDDIKDKDTNKNRAKIFEKFMKGSYEKVYQNRPELCEKVKNRLEDLDRLEKEKCKNLDETAETFAKIMEAIFVEGLEVVHSAHSMELLYNSIEQKDCQNIEDIKNQKNIFARIGYHIGKWVYLIDAFDDVLDNIETGAYNPLIYRFNYTEGQEKKSFKNMIKEDVQRNLIIYLAETAKSIDLLDIKKNKGIIENIIYVGLLKKTDQILGEGDK